MNSESSPSSLGHSDPSTVAPTPTWIPSSVGRLMTSTSDPRRSRRASRRITPTRRVKGHRSPGMSVEVATTPAETSEVAVNVAMVEVVDTLMAREPPIAA